MKLKFSIHFLIVILFFSCDVDDDITESIQITETIIKGHVSDVERNIDIEGFRIVLGRLSYCGSWFTSGPCTEVVETVYTDANGDYLLQFDYIRGEEYVFIKQYYGTPYYTEHINPTAIIEGDDNIRDINAWYPTILKLELNVTNNEFPYLRVRNKIIENESLFFGTSDIYEMNIDTTVYQRTKLNSEVELMFYYSTSGSNGITHRYYEDIVTTLQDTISFSYEIDCSSF